MAATHVPSAATNHILLCHSTELGARLIRDGMVAAVLLAFGSAIAGAVVGAYLQRRWTADPSAAVDALRKQLAVFQQRIETLEGERSRRRELQDFRPSTKIVGESPGGQRLKLEATREFTLKRLDYLAENDVMVACDDLNFRGEEVEAPIDNNKIVQIHNLQPRTGSHPIPIKLRCHLVVEGYDKTHLVEALIKPEIKTVAGTSTYCLTVVGGL